MGTVCSSNHKGHTSQQTERPPDHTMTTRPPSPRSLGGVALGRPPPFRAPVPHCCGEWASPGPPWVAGSSHQTLSEVAAGPGPPASAHGCPQRSWELWKPTTSWRNPVQPQEPAPARGNHCVRANSSSISADAPASPSHGPLLASHHKPCSSTGAQSSWTASPST